MKYRSISLEDYQVKIQQNITWIMHYDQGVFLQRQFPVISHLYWVNHRMCIFIRAGSLSGWLVWYVPESYLSGFSFLRLIKRYHWYILAFHGSNVALISTGWLGQGYYPAESVKESRADVAL